MSEQEGTKCSSIGRRTAAARKSTERIYSGETAGEKKIRKYPFFTGRPLAILTATIDRIRPPVSVPESTKRDTTSRIKMIF